MFGEVIILVTQGVEEHFEIIQSFHQDAGVGVEETQREPLEDQIQTAHGGVVLASQVLSKEINKESTGYSRILNGSGELAARRRDRY